MARLGDEEHPRTIGWLRIAGIGELTVGVALLIAGFASDATIPMIVGAALAASSGTMFMLAQSITGQHAAARAADPVPDPPAIRAADGRESVDDWYGLPEGDRDHLLNIAALALDGAGVRVEQPTGDPVLRTPWGDVTVDALLEVARDRPRSEWADLAHRWGRRVAGRRIPPD